MQDDVNCGLQKTNLTERRCLRRKLVLASWVTYQIASQNRMNDDYSKFHHARINLDFSDKSKPHCITIRFSLCKLYTADKPK